MKHGIYLLLTLTLGLSCGQASIGLKSAREIADVSTVHERVTVTADNADSIIAKYTIDFEIPNPLFSGLDTSLRRQDPNHEPTILCKGILLTDLSTEAHILSRCKSDSLNQEQFEEFKAVYVRDNVVNDAFRILVSMESGFSDKSMEPGLWAFYIENAKGVMIEPSEVRTSPVQAVHDSIYSAYYRMNFPRNILKSTLTLYFKTMTFYGQPLFSQENPFIVFVMSREQKVVTRVGWKLLPAEK